MTASLEIDPSFDALDGPPPSTSKHPRQRTSTAADRNLLFGNPALQLDQEFNEVLVQEHPKQHGGSLAAALARPSGTKVAKTP